ncbi:MAG: DUF2252 family protein [Bacteriovoracaceae bacterium]
MEEYLKRSQLFEKRLQSQSINTRDARFLFFRMMGPLMQSKMGRFLDLSKIPTVFMHGNPHLDNYIKTFQGAGMVDFDRSRLGPYAWDIIRFLSSVSLKRQDGDGFLDRKVVEAFIDGYFVHFLHPDIPYKQIKSLKEVNPQKWQVTTKDYLKANKKWAKKMRDYPISPKNADVSKILTEFLRNRHDENLLDDYTLDEAGFTPGTLGKEHYIFSLVPKNPDSHLDSILLDMKEVYVEKNTKYFYSPCEHNGERMILASKIFADGLEQRLGFFTYNNRQYWGRQIPSFVAKVKGMLNKEEQIDVAYSVGTQLGKGHRKSIDQKTAELIEKDFHLHFDTYYKISKLFTYEVSIAFSTLLKKNRLYQDFKQW